MCIPKFVIQLYILHTYYTWRTCVYQLCLNELCLYRKLMLFCVNPRGGKERSVVATNKTYIILGIIIDWYNKTLSRNNVFTKRFLRQQNLTQLSIMQLSNLPEKVQSWSIQSNERGSGVYVK